jgi:hypothetical protein
MERRLNFTVYMLALSFMICGVTGCSPVPVGDSTALPAVSLTVQPPIQESIQDEVTPFPTELATMTPSSTHTLLPTEVSTQPSPQAITLTPTYQAFSEPSETPVFLFAADENPLTGEKVTTPAVLERRPVFVKVSNYPPYVRPQSGLAFADIVFEYFIGEGMNRFLAVFYGQDAYRIGPIRSGRLVDAQLAEMYQGILSYGNADVRVDEVILNVLGDRAIATRDSPCPPVCGKETHSYEGVFADSDALQEYLINSRGIDISKPDLTGMVFDTQIPDGGEPGKNVAIQYSSFCRGEWRYNQETKEYLRWAEKDLDVSVMEPQYDHLTNEQLAFSNVIIIFSEYVIYTDTLHDVEIWRNMDGQRAVLFRDGEKFEGFWKTVSDTRPIHFFDTEGQPLHLKPGTSWVVLAGQSSSFFMDTGTWELGFNLP